MSLFGDGEPQTTGSIAPPVEVQRPLPATLAYSDATKIGEAANIAFLGADAGTPEDWINATTGSSGTVETALGAEAGADCRQFSTIVTSLSGVHQYSGAVCQRNGRPVVQIDERSPEDRT